MGRGRCPVRPGLAAGTHTWVCLLSPHRCLQLLILCCQTQVGNLPRERPASPHVSHPPKGEGQSPFFGQRPVLASLWRVRGSSSEGEQEKGLPQIWGSTEVFMGVLSLDPPCSPWGLCLALHPSTLGHPKMRCRGHTDLRDGAGSGWKRVEVMAQVRLVGERTGFHAKPPVYSTPDHTPTNTGVLGGAVLGGYGSRVPSQGR